MQRGEAARAQKLRHEPVAPAARRRSNQSLGPACETGAKPPPAPARQGDLLVDATLHGSATLGKGQVMRPPQRILQKHELPGPSAKPLEPVPNPAHPAPKAVHLTHALPVRFITEQTSYELAYSSLGLSPGDR